MENLNENTPRESGRVKPLRLWLQRLLLVAVWFVVYLNLPDPLDPWFGTMTAIAFTIWLYNRLRGRLKLPPMIVKFERVETITLTHVLLGILLLVAFASYSELVKLNRNTVDVQTDLVDLQNAASDNKDEIKSSLDDVTNAIEGTR